MAKRRTDPELVRQLDEAKKSGDTVEAVVQLERQAGTAPVPDAVRAQAERAIRRATEVSGEDPADVNVMANLATAYVSGSEKFVRELVTQPEVASAVANQSRSTD
jgi:protein-disulfide isomerase-like protein with CxxC motif